MNEFLKAGKALIEELSRERLPKDVILRKLLELQSKVSDAIAEATLKDDTK